MFGNQRAACGMRSNSLRPHVAADREMRSLHFDARCLPLLISVNQASLNPQTSILFPSPAIY
jgi:hypothetical protein